MIPSEERPSKIRRLDSGVSNDHVAGNKFNGKVEVLATSTDEAIASSKNDPTKALLSAMSGNENSLSTDRDGDTHETQVSQPLSKNQLKKLLKKQIWEEGREYRKAKRREKDKQKKIRKAEARDTLDLQNAEDRSSASDPLKRNTARPVQLPITFILDCDFDDLMTEAELISLGAQLTRCYSDNKSAPYRAHLVVSSFSGKLKHRFETVLASNHLGWRGVKFSEDDFVAAATEADAVMRGANGGLLVGAFAGVTTHGTQIVEQPLSNDMGQLQCLAVAKFENPSAIATACEETSAEVEQPTVNETILTSAMDSNVEAKSSKTNKSNDILHDNQLAKAYEDASSQSSKFPRVPSIIYLTSDSPHTLDVLSPFTTYVIGGIVDKNRHKGLCYKRAMARDIPTARLPIGEYMTMQSRSVLTTNHVAEIMLRWLEYGDWAKAFLRVIPKRKEARLKPNHGTDENSQGKRDGNISSDSQGD